MECRCARVPGFDSQSPVPSVSADLCDLIPLHDPASEGSVIVVARFGRVIVSTDTATLDDAIGTVAVALRDLLARRERAAAAVAQWIPEGLRS